MKLKQDIIIDNSDAKRKKKRRYLQARRTI
ncbi:hypothetical protein EV586_10232 [Tumebacillus sp. BK434]|nr:hypothetical protein EV586_10232 [Tumebacillus sp. BK434]